MQNKPKNPVLKNAGRGYRTAACCPQGCECIAPLRAGGSARCEALPLPRSPITTEPTINGNQGQPVT